MAELYASSELVGSRIFFWLWWGRWYILHAV